MPHAPLEELVEALDRFLEKAGHAKLIRGRATYVRKYKKLIAERFVAQRDWFLAHALPLLEHRLGESLREADSDAAAAEAIAALIDHWLDDPDKVRELNEIRKLALAAGVDLVTANITKEELAAALSKLVAKRGTLRIEFGLDNPKAAKWLEEHAFELASESLDATTRDVIKGILTDAMENHLGYNGIEKQIRAQFNDWTRSRAITIANYEMGSAYTQGTLAAGRDLDEAGLDMEKAWLTAGDAEDECVDNEDAGWIDIDDTFPSGDDAPLAHPNCRCALQVRKAPVEVAA